MQRTRNRKLFAGTIVGAGIAVLAAACGTSNAASNHGSAGSTGNASATVTMRTVGGMKVLVDSAGKTLYVNEQESNGHLLCTSTACTSIWPPLTVSAGTAPTAGSGVTGKLGTVQRADGTRQVTLAGKPLYTFKVDSAPGQVAGNGAHDSFGGTNFTWHAAGAAGKGAAPAASASSGYSY
jgi:predicted lipoprotein with Yx(FWY)xxD motif